MNGVITGFWEQELSFEGVDKGSSWRQTLDFGNASHLKALFCIMKRQKKIPYLTTKILFIVQRTNDRSSWKCKSSHKNVRPKNIKWPLMLGGNNMCRVKPKGVRFMWIRAPWGKGPPWCKVDDKPKFCKF